MSVVSILLIGGSNMKVNVSLKNSCELLLMFKTLKIRTTSFDVISVGCSCLHVKGSVPMNTTFEKSVQSCAPSLARQIRYFC